jgi:hypothetical protein
MAIRNVDDLYNELSSDENFSGLFTSSEDFATALGGMSPERRDAFFEKTGLTEQVSKVDFDKVLKKKDDSLSNLQLVGDDSSAETDTPQPKPSVPRSVQPQGNTQNNDLSRPPQLTLGNPPPGSPLKPKTLEERFPQTEEEKKKQQRTQAIGVVTEELKKKKDVYTPPKKPTPEQVRQSIAIQKQFEQEQKNASDMPVIKAIDYEAVAAGSQFVKKREEAEAQKKAEEMSSAKASTNSLFDGLGKGVYDYTLPTGEKFQLDEYAIGRALFENEPIEIFTKSGIKVDVLDPTKDLMFGENNFNVIDDNSIRDHFSRLGLSEEQADEEILRMKQLYLQQGAKNASKSLYGEILQRWNGNEALANQNYLAYWNNRGLDLLEGSEKEAYTIVKQMEALRSKLIDAQKKGGLANYNNATIQSYTKQLSDLQDQLSELRDNPNNLYDWRTGQFIDTRISQNSARASEIQQENKEFQVKYGDKPKEVLVKRRDELLAERAFILSKMRDFNLDIPEEGTWDAAVRALQVSAARLSGSNTITLPDGRTIDSKAYERKMRDYNSQLYSTMSELYGLNRAVMLNENVALRKESESILGSLGKVVGIAGESIVREFAPGTTAEDANSEYNMRNSLLNSLEESGYTIDPSLRSTASASVSETISGSAGMLLSSMLQIAVGNVAVPEVMTLRWAKQFKDILTNKYGKLGAAVFENTANAVRTGAIFETAGQGFSTGVGEYSAQAAFDLLNLDNLLGSKGRLAEFLYRTLIGGVGETFEEVAGGYIGALTEAGYDPNKAFKDSFGVTPESRLDQLLVIGITSLGFSGASNLKILTAERSTLNEILENPKLAAAYGEVLTEEKRQQIEEVLRAIDDKLADKQSRQTNTDIAATESSEYTPRPDAQETQKQVELINQERLQALEQNTPVDGPQNEEQQAEMDRRVAEINAEYDNRINAIMPAQTSFDTVTGTNSNAILGNADLNSEQTQNFLASLPNARARRNAATLIAVANNANTTLGSVLPNAKVVLHSRESFRDKMSQVGAEADRKGNFSIVPNPDGTFDIEIQINVEDGSVTDIAHEVTHGVLFSKFYGDDKRLAEIAEVMADKKLTAEQSAAQVQQINDKYETQFSETLSNFKNQLKDLVNEKGNKYLENFVASYDENARAEEYLAELVAILAKNGEQISQEDPTFFDRLMALLNRLVGVIGKEAGIKLQKFNDTQEVIDFFNTVASSIRKGEVLIETKPKTDAVQEQTAGQVPVQPEATIGQEVEQGKPQAKPQSATQNKARKEEITKIFEANNELKNIGTEDQYSSYLDSIFPESKVKDIVYHRSPNKFDKFDKKFKGVTSKLKDAKDGFFFSSRDIGEDIKYSMNIDLGSNVYNAILNIKNPVETDTWSDTPSTKGFDGINRMYDDFTEYVAFEPEQIHILGNQKDIEGFREFVQAKPQSTTQNKPRKEEVKKDLKEKLAKGEVDNVTLTLLEDYGKQLTEGEVVYDRFLEEENSGFSSGGEILAESAVLVGRNAGTDETQDERVDRQEAELEAYAKLKGIWIENTEESLEEQYGEPIGSGQESIVFGTSNGTVVKTSNTNQYRDHAAAIESIVLSNAYFPEAAQKIIGFGLDSDGEFQIVTEQQYFPQDEEITQEEIIEFLGNLGFELNTKEWSGEGTRFVSENVLLNDASPKNFIKTNGVLIPIDVIMKFNTADLGLGGKRVFADTKVGLDAEPLGPPRDIVNKGRVEPWSTPQQQITSAGTSINKAKLPSFYSDKRFFDLLRGVPGKRIVIADIGSGKYANLNIKPLLERGEVAEFITDSSKQMLNEKAVPVFKEVLGGKEIVYHPYDPFNQPASVNENTIENIKNGGADIAISPNVLNVIAEFDAREGVIANLANAVGNTGTAVIQIYEGDPKDRGTGKETKTGGGTSWQNNQPAAWYLPEVQAYFANVKRSGNMIFADNKGQEIEGMPISGAQKIQVKNKARIEEKVSESKAYKIPQRHKGDVGKMIGGDLYVHYSANDVLPQAALVAAENKLPEGFEYEVIKYNAADGSFSFIASPDWNTSHEPIVGDAYKVKKNGEVSVTRQKENPQIYHHKWNFVRDDYSGFNVEQSIQRSIDWYRDAKSDVEMTKIGYQNYWKENALPLINDTTKIINKGRRDRVDFAIVKDYEQFRNNGFSVDGAYFELEKMNYSPGDIKRYVPEIAEAWRKRSLNKFFNTIRKHRGIITKRQAKIREELQKNPGLDFDTLYDMLKDQYEDFELYKAFYEEGANPIDLDKIFGTEYRETIQKALEETRNGRTVYNRDFLREIKEDARARKMVDSANQMNELFGFFNGAIDNQQMIELLADGLEETGLEFSLQAVTDDIRAKRAELENDVNVLKKIGKGEVVPKDMVNVARLLSLAGRMLRMGRGLFQNQESFEKAIFDYLENLSYKTEVGGIVRKFKAFKLTYWQKRKISDAIKAFREAKLEYDKEIQLLKDSPDAYTDQQFEAFDKSKRNFEQSARKLKVTIDAYKKVSTGNWFTSITALALLSFRTMFVGLIGNLEMQLAALPNNKGKSLMFGWSRKLANNLVSSFSRASVTDLASRIKRGAYGNVDPAIYRKMAMEQGIQQIKNIFENTIASVSTNEDAFFESQPIVDSTKELPLGFQMVNTLIKNLFKKDADKMDDREWAEKFDQLLVYMNEKDADGNNKLELMNPKGYQALTILMRGIFGYIPSATGKAIALSGDRVFYQLGYNEALASYAYSQGITDPAEVNKFIRLNSVPNQIAGDVAVREGERRIFANDNKITDWFAKVRGNIAKAEKNLYAKSVKLKKEGKYAQRFVRIYPQKIGLATKKMGLTLFSPFTRIPSNFVGTAVEKTLFPVSLVAYIGAQRKLNRAIREYDEKFNLDQHSVISMAKQKEQEKMRVAIFEQQRKASRLLTSTFQASQLLMLGLLLVNSGAVGAPYGDDEEEKAAARAAGVAGQPPGRINVTALIDYFTSGFDSKGRGYKEGDLTFQYTNLGIFGFAMTWFSTLNASIAAKEFEDRKVLGVGEDGYSNVTFNMVAESIANGITSLSFIQNIASLVSSLKAGREGFENFGVNLAKTALTVPSMAYGIFGAVEKAEGITADNMRNYFPDLESQEIGSKFKMKLWTSLTGKSPITLFGLKNSKGEFLSPFASPYYQPQLGPHGEELYKKNTFWDVRSGELTDRVAAYLQASFDPFSFSDYEGFVSSVKKYDPKQTYYPGDIVDDGNFVYAVKKEIAAGKKFKELNLDEQSLDYETITSTSDFFDKKKYTLNKQGSEATTQMYNLMSLYQKATGSRKEFQVLNRYFEPFVQGKDAEGVFSIYVPLKYQRELSQLRGDAVLKSYQQQSVQETITRIERAADEMDDDAFNAYVEEQVENLLSGPIDPINLTRSGGIKSKINDALDQVENSEKYRSIKRKAITEALEAGLFTQEEYDKMKDAEGVNSIVADIPKEKLKFRK